MDNANCSEDELPPAFEYEFPSDIKINVEDIVWAKYRKAYWPAVVRRIYKRQRKASIMFVDSPHAKRLTLPFRSIVPFNSQKGRELQSQRVDAAIKDEFRNSVNKVDDFMCKRVVTGMTTSPIKYFQSPFGICDDNSGDEEFSDVEEEHEDDDEVGKEDGDSSTDDIDGKETEETNASENESSCEATSMVQSNQSDIETNTELLNLIRSQQCQLYLEQIFNEEIECDRHQKFLSVTPSIRRQLKMKSGFGPISDDQQLSELCSYLMKNLRYLTAKRGHFDVSTYLFEVWIPQAIIWALSQFYQKSLNDAEVMFIGQRET